MILEEPQAEENERTLAIKKAAENGQLNQRQVKAMMRHQAKQTLAHIEEMLKLMGHITFAKAYKEAKKAGPMRPKRPAK